MPFAILPGPSAAVLLVERYQCPIAVHPGASPRIMQQHKGGQCLRVARVGHQRAHLTGEPDTFVAQLVANGRRPRGRPVALGEHRVDAAEHVRRALSQQLDGRDPQRDVRVPDLAPARGSLAVLRPPRI